MKNYIVELVAYYTNGRSEYRQVINADSKKEATRLFVDGFNFEELSDFTSIELQANEIK